MKIFYADSGHKNHKKPNAIRIHPLLLSLSETFQASGENPDIGAISENDKRLSGNELYTRPSALPPLEIHFSSLSCSPFHSS